MAAKDHGDVLRPTSIVITRKDYLSFDRDSSPAGALVQSRMLTSHILFVGYSVSDENISRLAREVQLFRQRFQDKASGRPVGTVLNPDVPTPERK